MNPFMFGQLLGTRMKTAGMLGDAADLVGQSWNNSARAFKGMTGSVGAGLGAAGAGLVGAGMQAINAPVHAYNALGRGVNAMTGGQTMGKANTPFSPETVNTAYGTARNFGNVAKGYGQDFVNSMGLGSEGLAGTTQGGSHGDDAWRHLVSDPAVSQGARDFSNASHAVVDTAAHIAPLAAMGAVAHGVGHAANAAPAVTTAGRVAQTAARAAAPAARVTHQLAEHGTAPGAVGKMVYDAARSTTRGVPLPH